MDYSRYYFPVLVQLAAYASFLIGGDWVWFGFATLPVLGLIDSVLPNDMAPRRMRAGLIADLPVWIATFLAVGMYIVAAIWGPGIPFTSRRFRSSARCCRSRG